MNKILVVEDDLFLGKIYESKLSKSEFEVQLARDGEEAMKTLSTFTPDLILLDLIMPKKDGFEVLAELKASSKWKNIPVIVTSNLSQVEDQEKALKLGAKEYVVKSSESLNGIVQKIINTLKK